MFKDQKKWSAIQKINDSWLQGTFELPNVTYEMSLITAGVNLLL